MTNIRKINWIKTGLLEKTPLNKQETIINNLDYTIDLLKNKYDSDNWDAEEWIIPIIIRISNIIEIDNNNYINYLVPKIISLRKENLIIGFNKDNIKDEIKIIENFVNNETYNLN